MFRNESGVYKLCSANTGAINFKVRYPTGMGFAVFTVTCKTSPKKELYQFFFGPTYRFVDVIENAENITRQFHMPITIGTEFASFWLTWHSNVINLGISGQKDPIFSYASSNIKHSNIGFIKFFVKSVRWPVEWDFEASPVNLPPLKDKKFQDGKLQWVPISDPSGPLPKDALIAGFEDEPLYIARGMCNRSLCPGKYVQSKKCAYLPWGSLEFAHEPETVQILTGYNVKWVKTKGDLIPDNAFVAGYSEVRFEPLYIGRAFYDNHLLVGKVHGLYKLCYLPYKGKEVEVATFEVLVLADMVPRGVFARMPKRYEPHRQLLL